MLWLLSLPFRILFGVLGLALGLVGGALALVGGVAAVVLLPVALLLWAPIVALRLGFGLAKWAVLAFAFALVATVVFLVALVPIIPVALVLGSVWLIARFLKPRPAIAA